MNSKNIFKAFLLTLAIMFAASAGVNAQSRSNRIFRDCAGTTTKAAVSVDVGGSITLTPCTGKTVAAPGIPLTSYLAASVVYTSNAVLANTGLSVTIPAAGNYQIEVVLHTTEDIGGLTVDFSGTATVANFIGEWRGTNGLGSDPAVLVVDRVTAAGTDYNGTGSPTAFYTFDGSAEFSAAGTFFLRAAQQAPGISPTTVLRGSVLKVTKL